MIDIGEAGTGGIGEGIEAKGLSLRKLSFLTFLSERGD